MTTIKENLDKVEKITNKAISEVKAIHCSNEQCIYHLVFMKETIETEIDSITFEIRNDP